MTSYVVFAQNDDTPVLRKCYPCMRHMQGDTIYARDCVLLKSGSRKNDLPFIAKIANLWEDPVNGEWCAAGRTAAASTRFSRALLPRGRRYEKTTGRGSGGIITDGK